MFTKEAATATIAAAAPQGDAPEGSLHYDSRGPTLFVRERDGWHVLGRVVLMEVPDNHSTPLPSSRLKGIPLLGLGSK